VHNTLRNIDDAINDPDGRHDIIVDNPSRGTPVTTSLPSTITHPFMHQSSSHHQAAEQDMYDE
jgi:hypothetical protein